MLDYQVSVRDTRFHRVSRIWNPSGTPDAMGRQRMAERVAKKFTARWIEAVSVQKRIDFTDPDVKGLALRVTPNGSKSWAYTYRRKSDGRKRRVTLGEFPAVSLNQARAKASGHRAAVADGADPASERIAQKKVEKTVDQLLDRYL